MSPFKCPGSVLLRETCVESPVVHILHCTRVPQLKSTIHATDIEDLNIFITRLISGSRVPSPRPLPRAGPWKHNM